MRRSTFHGLYLLPAILALTPILSWANVTILGNRSIPEADIAMLPPVCKLILVEVPGVHLGGGSTSTKYRYLLDKPQYRMARNNKHVHHYCWALLSKLDYFRARTNEERKFWYGRVMDDTNYVLQHSPKDWPYFYVILLEQSRMMVLQGDYRGSLAKTKEALKRNPDDEQAYALEFDAYMKLNSKDRATAAAQEGLKKNPASKILRRRLQEVGVDLPGKGDPRHNATLNKNMSATQNSPPRSDP